MPVNFTPALIDQIIKGRCADFASMMGMRKTKSGELQINVFMPGATAVEVLQRNGKKVLLTLTALHHEGLFSGILPGTKTVPYKLRVHDERGSHLRNDPYRFPSRLDKADMQLFSLGQHESAWQLLGAHACSVDDVEGVQFVLWAPQALRVSLLCEMNRWDGRCYPMRRHQRHGLWELFVPDFTACADGLLTGYRFEVLTADLRCVSLAFDPYARRVSKLPTPHTHVDPDVAYHWQDHFWQQVGRDSSGAGRAIAIREVSINLAPDVHLPGWTQLKASLLEEISAQGFTHVLLADGTARAASDEHATCGLLAPDPAMGSPDELRAFIDHAHALGLGVLWDVPLLAALNSLGAGEAAFTLLDPLLLDGPLQSILLGYFLYWRESFHVDGFRVRDLDQLLQLQHKKAPGKTARKSARNAAETGNPLIRDCLSRLLQNLRNLHPDLLMLAETSMQHELFTQAVQKGGLGYDYCIQPNSLAKTLQAPADLQASIRSLVLALQDGNRGQGLLSLPARQISGNSACVGEEQQALVAILMLALWTLPGRKHVQLDCCVPTDLPCVDNGDALQPALGWWPQAGHLLRQLNQLYQSSPSLYEIDASHEGIAVLPASAGVIAWQRRGRHAHEVLLIALNFGGHAVTAEINGTHAGIYRLRLHTGGASAYAAAFPKVVQAGSDISSHGDLGHGQKLLLELPALSGAVYAWQG